MQEANAEAGDHIVRARGAWFGNRSISAEVDLEVGTYEVLPKIEASRDADAPDVHEVVTKVAESNPQKLRQIGMNYDIANAKGVAGVSEEEKKKKEQKKKEAAEKKKKEREEEQKEKADFEAWKKEEKAEYEAWKKEKNDREEKDKPKQEGAKEAPKDSAEKKEETDAVATAVIADSIKAQKDEAVDTTAIPAEEAKPEVVIDLTIRAKDSESQNEIATGAPSNENAAEPIIEVDEPSDDEEAHHTPDNDDDVAPRHRGPPGPPSNASFRYGHRYQDSLYGDAPPPPPPPAARSIADNEPRPWNAVCVLGLRVYSQDPEVSIKLVKPKDLEEGAILDVDGDTAAGATM